MNTTTVIFVSITLVCLLKPLRCVKYYWCNHHSYHSSWLAQFLFIVALWKYDLGYIRTIIAIEGYSTFTPHSFLKRSSLLNTKSRHSIFNITVILFFKLTNFYRGTSYRSRCSTLLQWKLPWTKALQQKNCQRGKIVVFS